MKPPNIGGFLFFYYFSSPLGDDKGAIMQVIIKTEREGDGAVKPTCALSILQI
jgi:hypothetical protein